MEGRSKNKGKESSASGQRRVGLLYDRRMCKHYAPNEPKHVENPNRIRSIWNQLEAANVPQRCVLLEAKKAEDSHVRLVHSRHHVNLIKNISVRGLKSRSCVLVTGSAVEIVKKVASGKLDSTVAIVRPPGSHGRGVGGHGAGGWGYGVRGHGVGVMGLGVWRSGDPGSGGRGHE
ncbi:hypothetical protein V8G54_015933 [Vigna mungo]|uniref:Histone deacetylase domain-containing protein n=1 Tax=Vigna mungo TaxID=3915 RepID=A0AAQ3RZZ1_VIGMU